MVILAESLTVREQAEALILEIMRLMSSKDDRSTEKVRELVALLKAHSTSFGELFFDGDQYGKRRHAVGL